MPHGEASPPWCASPVVPRVEQPLSPGARRSGAGGCASGSGAARPQAPAVGWRAGGDPGARRLPPVLEPGARAPAAARFPPPADRGHLCADRAGVHAAASAKARSCDFPGAAEPMGAPLPPRAVSAEFGAAGQPGAPKGLSAGFRASARGVRADALAAVAMPLGGMHRGACPGALEEPFCGAPGGAGLDGPAGCCAGKPATRADPAALGGSGWQQHMRWPSLAARPPTSLHHDPGTWPADAACMETEERSESPEVPECGAAAGGAACPPHDPMDADGGAAAGSEGGAGGAAGCVGLAAAAPANRCADMQGAGAHAVRLARQGSPGVENCAAAANRAGRAAGARRVKPEKSPGSGAGAQLDVNGALAGDPWRSPLRAAAAAAAAVAAASAAACLLCSSGSGGGARTITLLSRIQSIVYHAFTICLYCGW